MLYSLLALQLLLLLWLVACAELENPIDSNKGAIVTLAQGRHMLGRFPYRNLVKHNHAIQKYVWTGFVDVIIFHEGNILEAHQKYLQEKSGAMPLKFINVSETFQLYRAVNKSFCPETDEMRPYGPGYRSMCRFWFSEFHKYLNEYAWAFRVDEDCMAESDITHFLTDREITSRLHLSASTWVDLASAKTDYISSGGDGIFVHNMKKLVREFAAEKALGAEKVSVTSWQAPYSSVMWINLNWYRANRLLLHFDEKVIKSECIYSGRWGDLPLWGAKAFLVSETRHVMNFSYHHLSHRIKIRPHTVYRRKIS